MMIGVIGIGCAHAEVPVAPPTGTGAGTAAPAAPANAPSPSQTAGSVTNPGAALTPASAIDDILDALDVRGKELKDFTANVTLSTQDSAVGNESKQSGKIWMQRLGPGDARLLVVFDRKQVNDQPATLEKQEILLDKGTLTERDHERKLSVVRQVLRPGEKMDLLKLGQGPFPLPLGQDKADVHRMFEVKKFDPKPTDPPGTIHLQLIPKQGTQFESKFATIDFWVDPASRMPIRIETQDPNGTTTKLTELKDVQVNVALADKDFTLPPVDGSWSERVEPFNQ
jgi:outer membrane lipoprotein-sorting protein